METDAPRLDYSFRSLLFRSERKFLLAPDGFVADGRTFAYKDVSRVLLYQVRAQDGAMFDRCKLRVGGRTILLQSMHVAGMAKVEDRKAWYHPFLRELLTRIVHANPAVRMSAGMPRLTRAGWLLALVLVVLLGLGGLALLLTGELDGLWLIGIALTTAPLAVSMMKKKPLRLIKIEQIQAPDGFRDLLG
jgi:hypothetical protein